jgi:hypothetical protein
MKMDGQLFIDEMERKNKSCFGYYPLTVIFLFYCYNQIEDSSIF